MVINHSEPTVKRRKLNLKRKKANTAKLSMATRVQTKTLDKLYLLACNAPDMRSLYALRDCRETKVLSKQNYSKFIRLLDRLMESV